MRYQYWHDRDDKEDLPIVFKVDDWQPFESYYTHWHQSVEIILITEGSVRIKNGDRTFYGKPGEMYIIHSTHLHSFQIEDQVTQYLCLIIHENLFPDKTIFKEPLPYMTDDLELVSLYRKAWKAYSEKPPFYATQTLGLLLQLYTALVTAGGEQKAEVSRGINKIVYRTARYIEHHYNKNDSIEDIAASIGVTPHHLCHVFKKFTGTTVSVYRQSVRCEAARLMLRNGATVAEAAEACGFSYSPYFARIYRKHFGVSPGSDKR